MIEAHRMILLFTDTPEGRHAAVKTSTQQGARQKVEWLDTGGGPFVILPSHSLRKWGGLRAEGAPNDFDRACDVTDYLGTIPFDAAQALVLGDDPFPTAFFAAPTFGGAYIVRMLWGEDLEKATRAVHAIPRSSWTTEQLLFDGGSGALVLFDAAHPGPQAPHRISVPLGPGRYAVASADWEDGTMGLLVHRLVPLS